MIDKDFCNLTLSLKLSLSNIQVSNHQCWWVVANTKPKPVLPALRWLFAKQTIPPFWISWLINRWRYQLPWLQGNGEYWCNGDCVWIDGQCEPATTTMSPTISHPSKGKHANLRKICKIVFWNEGGRGRGGGVKCHEMSNVMKCSTMSYRLRSVPSSPGWSFLTPKKLL